LDSTTRFTPPISGARVSNSSPATPRMPPGICSSSRRLSASLIMAMALLPLCGGMDEWPGVPDIFITTDI